MPNILISTLGATPDIIEETVGIFNYDGDTDFYREKKSVSAMRGSLQRVDEVWLVATDQHHKDLPNGKQILNAQESYDYICQNCAKYGASIRMFVLDGVADIMNETDARAFHDLLLRVVAFAHQEKKNGKLYLSLACGRKTMSTDMQDAALVFGCDNLLHVLGDKKDDATPMLMGAQSQNEAIRPQMVDFKAANILRCKATTDFLLDIEQQKQQSQHFFTTYYLNEQETRSNFHILYTLPPSKIEQLKNEKIGVNPKHQKAEMAWLKRLPKTDLHCHLGGVLNIEEIISVASNFYDYEYAEENRKYKSWLKKDKQKLFNDFIKSGWKSAVKATAQKLGVPNVCIVAPLLSQFKGRETDLKQIWYGTCSEEAAFCGVGIEKYEQLGDLQGSLLLDSFQSLENALALLLNRCFKENVKYLEVRCSPFNYVTNGIPAECIVMAICSILEKVYPKVETSLIFIISRHRGDTSTRYIDLVKRLKNNEWFNKFFRGFDLAGNESIAKPEELRQSFLDIMRECYNITIHAGETEQVENIWQAVYHLNAERVGHGLHLLDNEELLAKFLERGIAVEMCPSSNFQIVGFRDNYFPKETASLPEYPLKAYLDKELKVSVNTDDPGISLTDMTHELHKAARMTPGGLSKWDILQLICNGFRSAFYPYEQKKQLIRKTERDLARLIEKGLL